MHINRNRSQKIFRGKTSHSGCVSALLLMGIMMGIGFLIMDRLPHWVTPTRPDDETLWAEIEAAMATGDLDTVVTHSQTLLDRYPGDIDALTWLIRALIYRSYVDYNHSGDRLIALHYTSQAYDTHPENRDIMALYAYVLQVNEHPKQANQLALQVINQDPQSIPARLALSLAYGGQGIFEAAVRDGVKAFELANTKGDVPWLVDALRVLAIAYQGVGKYDEARITIERAIALNRRLIPLYFEHAMYARQMGDYNTATASYFNVIAFDSTNAKAYLRLCEISSKLRETAAALNYCQKATDYAPSWSMAWYQLGHEYYLQGRYSDAQYSMNRCATLEVAQDVAIEDRQIACWILQGQAAEIRGDCQGLLSIYDEFQAMRQTARLTQNWVYPPEGPNICQTPQPSNDH